MKKTLTYCTLTCLLFLSILSINSCKKLDPGNTNTTCPHTTDGLIVKKWSIRDIKIDTYTGGTISKTTHDHPSGFINFSSNGTYSAASDGIVINGKWLFDKNCNLGLTGGGNDGIVFNVVKLTSDSLIISKKVGDLVITQTYSTYACSCHCYLERKWLNVYTQEDTYSNDGSTITGSTTIYPVGFFEINPDSTYRVWSNNVPLNGKWKASSSYCQLMLDSGTNNPRTFEIVKASGDSLVIRRKDGNVAYTQHYVAYKCPTLTQLEQTWDNIDIKVDNVTNGAYYGSYMIYPVGTFQLNLNATYNVLSNGVPQSGPFVLTDQQHGCQVVLDPGTSVERAFDVTHISSDSLTIFREDLKNGAAYTQRYKKH